MGALLATSFFSYQCLGQGSLQTLHITFEEPPLPLTTVLVQEYVEAGIVFSPVGVVGFRRIGNGTNSRRPANGTAYVQADLESALMLRAIDGRAFNLLSLDLAEYSVTDRFPGSIHLMGYRLDGSIVTADLNTDGIIDGAGPLADFQTFYLDSQFSDLIRVEIPTASWTLDNVVVAIPEPRIDSVLALSGVLFCAQSLRNRTARIHA